MKKIKVLITALCFLWPSLNHATSRILEKTEIMRINLCHSLEGPLAVHFEKIVQKFNATHPKILIMPSYGGDYTTSFQKTFAEKDPTKRPHLLFVAEYNTQTMYEQKEDYVSLDTLLNVNEIDFIPVVKSFYSFQKGSETYLPSLPFISSAPVMYYNKKAFKEAGLSQTKPPLTWEALEAAALKLKAAAYKPFTAAWRVAYLLEHFSSVHGMPFAKLINNDSQIALTLHEKPYIEQLKRFASWHQQELYADVKNNNDAEDLFARGEVAILFQGSNREEVIRARMQKAHKNFDIGVAPYPFLASLVSEPYAPNVGGTSLWVLSGHEEDQEGVVIFLTYLASPEVQAEWHQQTGYLPVTQKAYYLTKETNFYQTHPVHEMACRQVIDRQASLPNGIRLPNYQPVREKISLAIDRILQGSDPEQEMKSVVEETTTLMNRE